MKDVFQSAQEKAESERLELLKQEELENNKPINKLKKNLHVVLLLVFILIGGISLLIVKSNFDKTANYIADINKKITVKQAEFDEIKDTKVVSSEKISKNKYSAKTFGDTIAKIQNQKQDPEIDKNEDYKKVCAEMDKMITSKDYKSNNKWYLGENKYEWKFMTDYEFTTDKISVLWLLFDKDSGALLKYVVATYNGITNDFTDFSSNETIMGISSYGVTGLTRDQKENGKVDVSAIDDLRAKIKKQSEKDKADGKSAEMTDKEFEEYGKLKEQQYEARQNMLREYLNDDKKEEKK